MSWSNMRDSNPLQQLGGLLCCQYTNSANGADGWTRTSAKSVLRKD